jgi:hypothetical protein
VQDYDFGDGMKNYVSVVEVEFVEVGDCSTKVDWLGLFVDESDGFGSKTKL